MRLQQLFKCTPWDFRRVCWNIVNMRYILLLLRSALLWLRYKLQYCVFFPLYFSHGILNYLRTWFACKANVDVIPYFKRFVFHLLAFRGVNGSVYTPYDIVWASCHDFAVPFVVVYANKVTLFFLLIFCMCRRTFVKDLRIVHIISLIKWKKRLNVCFALVI